MLFLLRWGRGGVERGPLMGPLRLGPALLEASINWPVWCINVSTVRGEKLLSFLCRWSWVCVVIRGRIMFRESREPDQRAVAQPAMLLDLHHSVEGLHQAEGSCCLDLEHLCKRKLHQWDFCVFLYVVPFILHLLHNLFPLCSAFICSFISLI